MQPTGTECGRCERMRLRKLVRGLQAQVAAEDEKHQAYRRHAVDRISELEGELDDARAESDRLRGEAAHLEHLRIQYPKACGRVGELEARCDAYANEVARLEPFEPRPGRVLRFRDARNVLVKPAGQCSTFLHVVDTVEIRF